MSKNVCCRCHNSIMKYYVRQKVTGYNANNEESYTSMEKICFDCARKIYPNNILETIKLEEYEETE